MSISAQICILINLFFLLACGVKTPPVVPKPEFKAKIYNVKVSCKNYKVKLSWEYEGKGIKTFKIMRLCASSAEKICEGCPLKLQEIAQIKPSTKPEMTWFDLEVKKYYQCWYQVCAVSPNQEEICSEVVQVMVK